MDQVTGESLQVKWSSGREEAVMSSSCAVLLIEREKIIRNISVGST